MQKQIKEKLYHELQRYFMYFIFLFLLFFAFTSYQHVLLDQFDMSYFPYGFCAIKALIMAKVIMIGEALHLGEKYAGRQLIFPVIYKTIVFCLLMLLIYIAEEIIKGWIHDHTIIQTYDSFINKNVYVITAQIIIMFFIFIFFFSVLETARALGGNTLFNMFFKRQG